MSYPRIIGLLGRSRCGKDTVASIIKNALPEQNYRIVRLSAPIKEAARHLFSFDEDQIEGHRKEMVDDRWGVTPRQVFQTITTDTMKYMGQDFFTRVLYEKFDNGILGHNIIIADLRFEHDIEEIKKRGGVVFKVVRTNPPVKYACEDHLDNIQELPIIRNDKSIRYLKTQVKLLLRSYEN